MTATRTRPLLRLDTPLRTIALVCVLTLAVGAGEALLFTGDMWATVWVYSLLVVAISLTPIYLEVDVPLLQAFALIAVFRLVNFAMPVFFDQPLLWIPLVYAPLLPVAVYLGRQPPAPEGPMTGRGESVDAAAKRNPPTGSRIAPDDLKQDLPWWLGGTRGNQLRTLFVWGWQRSAVPHDHDAPLSRGILHWIARGLLLAGLLCAVVVFLGILVVLTVYVAEFEYATNSPTPLIPSLAISHLAMLAVVMFVFVGFVEELLFRGLLQPVLERHLGLVPGLLLASGLFGLVYAGHGVPVELAIAGGIGLLFGIIYDVTESLGLVACLHGLLNVLVFGIIPLSDTAPTTVLHAVARHALEDAGLRGLLEASALLEGGILAVVV